MKSLPIKRLCAATCSPTGGRWPHGLTTWSGLCLHGYQVISIQSRCCPRITNRVRDTETTGCGWKNTDCRPKCKLQFTNAYCILTQDKKSLHYLQDFENLNKILYTHASVYMHKQTPELCEMTDYLKGKGCPGPTFDHTWGLVYKVMVYLRELSQSFHGRYKLVVEKIWK